MPANLDPLFADAPPNPFEQQHARDERELVSLRATVVGLLEEIRRGAGPPAPEQAPAPAAALLTAPSHQAGHESARTLAGEVAVVHEGVPQTEFLSMLAHELRNPLQSMAMASQLLAGVGAREPLVAQAHGVLERQISHMSRLLDELLDASRAANGKMVLKMAPLLLRDVINAAVETSQSGVHRRRQDLQVAMPEAPILLEGDLIRLAQVFSNLLANASQFSDTGGRIAVSVACQGGFAEITVSDEGAGIPHELQPFVFDMFRQGHRTIERAAGGLGIGLSLVRTIVALHGGSASVSSAGAGAGSCFTVRLPLAPVPVSPPAATFALSASCAARRILVIEDNVDANEIMVMLLSMEGHRVSSSFDGIDGLRAALESDYDIVLCDLGLPGLTGFEVVAAIKAARGAGAPTVIATTGYSDSAQRDLARASGFDHFLVKPLDLPALFQILAQTPR